MVEPDVPDPLLSLSDKIIRAAGAMNRAAANIREFTANTRYLAQRHRQPGRKYQRAMQQHQEWQHTDPDQVGRPPVVKLARAEGGGTVACTVVAVAQECPLGCCQAWEATPTEPVEVVIAAAPGEERNAMVTGLGTGDSVHLRLLASAAPPNDPPEHK